MVYYTEGINYYGDVGCCITCSSGSEGCLCHECKCRQCSQYTKGEYDEKGYCFFAWEQEKKWKKLEIKIDARLKETEKAYLVVIDSDEIWLPKSLVKVYSKDTRIFVLLPRWLAIEKGIAEYD